MSAAMQFPQGPLLDTSTGQISLEWVMWLQNPQLVSLTVGGNLIISSAGAVTLPGLSQVLAGKVSIGIDGQDGEDGWMGNPGAIGPQGRPGTFTLGMDGLDGEDTSMLPAPVSGLYDRFGAAAAITPTTLGLLIGTNVQAYNANLTAINQALTTTSSPSFTTVTAALTGHASLDLPLTGGTLTGNLLFTDATYDIGASGATRPRNMFLTGNISSGAGLGLIAAGVANAIITANDGVFGVLIRAGTGGQVNLGNGTTNYLTLSGAGALSVVGTMQTGDPGLGAGAWKLGQVESGLGLALNTASYVQVMVDGAAVKLAQVL